MIVAGVWIALVALALGTFYFFLAYNQRRWP